jgi:hypothetical protein
MIPNKSKHSQSESVQGINSKDWIVMSRKNRLFTIVVLTFSSTLLLTEGNATEQISPVTTEAADSDSQTVTYQQAPQNRTGTKINSLTTVPSPCKLQLQNVYLRQSYGYGAVGTKAVTTCTVPVTSIKHDTYIQKSGLFGWSTQKGFSGSSKFSSSFSQLDIAVTCTNGLRTTWTGYTDGVVVYQGVQYYATVRVANTSATFNCGT